MTAEARLRAAWAAFLGHRWLPIAALTAFAAVLFTWQIGERSLWLDEATSVTFARRFVADFPVFSDYNMTLYYGLLYVWMTMGFGESEVAVRLLSAVAATAAVPVFYLVARRVVSSGMAVLATLLLIVNSFVVYYAQETRGYALLLFFVVLSAWLLLRAIERPSWPRWAALASVAILAMYTHFFAGLVLLAYAAVVIVRRDARLRDRWVAIAAIMVAVAAVPLAVAVAVRGACQIDYIDQASLRRLTIVLQEVAGDQGLGRSTAEAFPFGAALLAAYAVVVGVGVFAGTRAMFDRTQRDERYVLPILGLLVPILAVVLASVLVTPVMLPRYLIILAPWMALLAAIGVDFLRPRWQGALLGALVLVASVAGTLHLYGLPSREEWRAVAATILDDVEPGDAVVFYTSSGEKPFGYYVRQADAVSRAPIQIELPSDGPCQIDEQYDDRLIAGLDRVDPTLHRRVRLVLTHQREESTQEAMIQERLDQSYRVEARNLIGEKIEVVLYEAVDAPTQAIPGTDDPTTARGDPTVPRSAVQDTGL
jgi:uncharacterized membrane protein